MNCKRIRFLMEMIFIFILPLLFILPCIKIKDNYVYDNVGNYQVSEKQFEFDSPLNLNIYSIVSETIQCGYNHVSDIAYDENCYLIIEELQTDYSGYYVEISDFDFITDVAEFYFDYYSSQGVNIGANSLYEYEIVGYTDVENNLHLLTDVNYFCDFLVDIIPSGYNLQSFYNGEGYVLIYSENVVEYNDYVEEEELNLFGQIKKIIVEKLNIQSNILVDLVITYVFLWFVMFIIWHLFYLLLDFLLHFWRKDDDK